MFYGDVIALPSCINPIGKNEFLIVIVPVYGSLSRIPKCLFNPTMRISKKPVSLCLSLFSPEIFPPNLSARTRFGNSGRIRRGTSGRTAIRFAGSFASP